MSKPVIAVDIDDVLAANAEGLVKFSNARWGTNLTVDDYQEHWSDMWGIDHAETEQRSVELHESGAIGTYDHYHEALDILQKLQKQFDLVIVTSRRISVQKETLVWLERNFGGIFKDVRFAGIYDTPIETEQSFLRTKADVFTAINAQFIIDDQIKHCLAAGELGVNAILFGDYPWNQIDKLPDTITKCADWRAVQEYFDGLA